METGLQEVLPMLETLFSGLMAKVAAAAAGGLVVASAAVGVSGAVGGPGFDDVLSQVPGVASENGGHGLDIAGEGAGNHDEGLNLVPIDQLPQEARENIQNNTPEQAWLGSGNAEAARERLEELELPEEAQEGLDQANEASAEGRQAAEEAGGRAPESIPPVPPVPPVSPGRP